ncbi:recombinase family protein [Streptomyces sp. KR55]|uniref:recombinase family protein n=1 Tax=Streptomyces sp. KR55 TaxID=3457425 RepID=UPI003FCF622C
MTALDPADEPGLLVAEPLVRTGIKIGYAPVSTGGQKPERQLDALTAPGCRKIFADKKSDKNVLRPELKACHAFLDPCDTLVVPSLDRYGRSLQDLINMVAELRERGVGFTSLLKSDAVTGFGACVTAATRISPEMVGCGCDVQ